VTEEAREQGNEAGGMSARAAAWLAWSLAGLSVAMFLANVVLYVFAHSSHEASSTGGVLSDLLFYVPFLAFPIVGALIASRRPYNPIGWICLAVGLSWMLGGLSEKYTAYGIAKPGSVSFVATIVALTQWMWIIPVGLLGTYLLLLFPNGRLPSRRWRPLAWLSGVVIVLLGVDSILAPGPLTDLEGVRNPFGLEGAPWLVDVGIVLLLLFVTCILASAVSLVSRYRRSGGEVREQIKWIALAGAFVGFLAFLMTTLGLLIVPEVMSGGGGSLPLWLQFLIYVSNLSFAGVPVAIGFAILRYRLYAIDLIINRTLVYGSLTVTLIALYVGAIVVLQRVFVLLMGQQSTLAVVASTLLIAALFNPLRRRIQAFIDKRFYRNKYDAAKTLEAFSARLRDETDLQALNGELTRVVRETMQPAHVSLWLRPEPPPRRSEGSS
jgi:NADH:ubiquinone oxidoreductase subunit 6 (subunit J)